MHCPACNVKNTPEATRCHSCGGALSRRARRRSGAEEPLSFWGPPQPSNVPAVRAFRLCLLGLIPGLGLLLGPLAMLLGRQARRRGQNDPEFTGHHPARAAIILGALITVTQWTGLALMLASF